MGLNFNKKYRNTLKKKRLEGKGIEGNQEEKTGNDQETNERYKRIEEAITISARNLMEISEDEQDSNNETDENIKTLHSKRAKFLKINVRTPEENIELNIISKTIMKKIAERECKKRNEIIKDTLQGDKNIRKMKNKISESHQWTTYFENSNKEKVYDRIEINKLITKFFTDLYGDHETKENEGLTYTKPEFLMT